MKDASPAQPGSAPSDPTARQAAEAEQRLLRQLRSALPLVAVVATVAVGLTVGPGPAVLVLTGFALLAAIESLWSSLQALLGEAPLPSEDAYAFGAPSTEEEQKRAVLRALKDLEFERSVGKISEADFARLTARYRAEAKGLLRIIDERARPGREKVEVLVDRLLQERGLVPATRRGGVHPRPTGEAQAEADTETETDADHDPHRCPKCQTHNDDDAAFCKKCGARIVPEDEASS
ncbi:MAG: zinc-ribbon domain-containing protein [Deltaproteobacteria bacterium]|nr:zinc-ribbon domain-containing protein [Deltaproteobacteria bacterium]